jgi:hypothetical protein
MRSKRLFAFFLALCLVFSTLAAPASAVVAPELSAGNAKPVAGEQNAASKPQTSSNANGLLVTEENAPQGPLSMRENPQLRVEVESNNENSNKGNWSVKPAEGKPSVSLLPTEVPEALKELQKDGFVICATALDSSVPLQSVDASEKMAFVFGNEGQGVSEEIQQLSDQRVRIEMDGFESLNVAVAAGIIMYRFQ